MYEFIITCIINVYVAAMSTVTLFVYADCNSIVIPVMLFILLSVANICGTDLIYPDYRRSLCFYTLITPILLANIAYTSVVIVNLNKDETVCSPIVPYLLSYQIAHGVNIIYKALVLIYTRKNMGYVCLNDESVKLYSINTSEVIIP